ncbi:hypothetical protein OEZ85_008454 [Tetradesmus obliquus]|uniref:SKI-interacting protein SKIP SNW domain-containing protein n=1 Tax=Tetradesmus obliquus TaxID=3088 RepID=A0ABY8TJ40_TETOB|nr:hypothetical protein OEZ85_008454 [Tetradesmus obliquus]
MGRPDEQKGGKTLAVSVDINGAANYDAILRQGQRANKVIHSGHKALVPKVDLLDPQNLARPDEEEVERTARETLEALNKRVNSKLATQNPSTLPEQPGAPTYIKYTPSQQGAAYASGAKQRIIKLQDMPVDPLEPPKFRHTKVPRGTGSPPVPVMHSPPRPVTAEDHANWKIPPCISNWKNAKGYTIPLDKRLAADGRGLQEQTISDKFASLSEALQVAESKAREATEMRKHVALEMARRQKQAKDEALRKLAQQARMERGGPLAAAAAAGGGGGWLASRLDAGGAPAAAAEMPRYPGPPGAGGGGGGGGYRGDDSPGSSEDEERRRGSRRRDEGGSRGRERDEYQETAQEREERRRRDELREERRRERERERRLEAKEGAGPAKKSKLTRDRERDVGEKIALGMANVGATGEVAYDSRLFNQEQGMGTGFGAEDSYSLYDKPLFTSRESNLFKPIKNRDEEVYAGAAGGDGDVRTEKFKADRGFSGAERDGAAAAGGKRGAGVEYEHAAVEADPFGLEQFMQNVDKGRRVLDGIGQKGGMAAGAGGGGYDGEGSGRRMQFTSGSQQ